MDWNTSEEALWDRLNGNTLKSKGSYLLYDNGDITLTPEVYSKLTGVAVYFDNLNEEDSKS